MESTLRSAETALAAGALETPLGLIRSQIEDWLAVPELTKNALWGSRELDALAARIGRIIAAAWSEPVEVDLPVRDASRPLDVYLFTRTEAGGHVRVAGDFVRAAPDRSSVVILTEQIEVPVAREFAEHFATPLERIVCLPNSSLLGKTRAVVSCLKQLRPDRLFLFNHHQDVSMIAAAGSGLVSETYYVHCCDFLPALGVFMPNATHLDITPRAHTFCRSVLGIPSSFTPLVAADRGCRHAVSRKPSGPRILATCGAPGKYDLSYRLPYHRVVAELLANTDATFYHIGFLFDEQLAAVRRALDDAHVAEGRWRHITSVPSVWDAMRDLDVDLYVNSFPQRGARVAVEVMGSGTPAVWHLGESRYRSAELHLAYPGAAAWTDADELIAIVRDLDGEWIESQSNAARAHYERAHHPSILADIVARDFDLGAAAISPHERLFSFEFEQLERSWHRLTTLIPPEQADN